MYLQIPKYDILIKLTQNLNILKYLESRILIITTDLYSIFFFYLLLFTKGVFLKLSYAEASYSIHCLDVPLVLLPVLS